MPGAHDAGGVMDIQAHIAFGGKLRFARVYAHADTDRHTCWPGVAGESPLDGHSCREGIGGASKGHEEGVSLRVDLVTVILVECCSQEASTLAEHLGVALAHLLEEGAGSLHVGEEQGHGAPWKVIDGGCPSPGFDWVSRGQDRERLSRRPFPASLCQSQ